MAVKVIVVRKSQSKEIGGWVIGSLWGTGTEAPAHIQEHEGGIARPIISGCGSDQGGSHPGPQLLVPRDRVKVNFSFNPLSPIF